jgi:predicted amidohydrolase YtcJ
MSELKNCYYLVGEPSSFALALVSVITLFAAFLRWSVRFTTVRSGSRITEEICTGRKVISKSLSFSVTVCSLLVVLLGCPLGRAAPERTADLVIWGGPIYTSNDVHQSVEAVAVKGARIVYTGDQHDARKLVGSGTEVIDLRGAALFPGFTDCHAHLRNIGEREINLNLEGAPSVAAVVDRLSVRVAQTRPGEVIVGQGWIETDWPEHRFLTRADIDAVSPANPVLLYRADFHAIVVNSVALRASHIDASTAAPAGGEIVKDSSGQLTGMLLDNARSLVRALTPPPDTAQRVRLFRTALTLYASRGWTGVHNMSLDWDDVEVLEKMDRDGEIRLRLYNFVHHASAAPLLEHGGRATADGLVVTRGVKFYADGALGSRGAALFEKYSDADTTGLVTLDRMEASSAYKQALKKGLQITTHAIGDRGNRIALDTYAQAFAEVPIAARAVPQPRWRIEHAGVLSPADIPRFGGLGVIASMQPSHAIGGLHFAPARLGTARIQGAYAWKSLLQSGALVVGGSDAPVSRGDPLEEFYAAVYRHDLKGYAGPDWHLEQALDRAAALNLFTAAAAYARFAEQDLGSITVGKLADFSAFSVDLMRAPPTEIPKAHAVLTVIGGRVVYHAPEPRGVFRN